MINWRKPVIHAAIHFTWRDLRKNLRDIEWLSKSSPREVKMYQESKLRALLKHAYRTVPYYRDLFEESAVAVDGEIRLQNFRQMPLLTKETLRAENDRLRSSEPGPEPYVNTSGGTTGEPVEFLQDRHYWQWNVANKIFYQKMAGKPLGGREVKLWGSERDLLEGSESLKSRAINFLYNRRALNSFRMGEKQMREYVDVINSFQPDTIWAYVESIHQLALFAQREGIGLHSPNGIVTTAGTLHEPVRETIEHVFQTTVYNQYGSREVGDMACECAAQQGLHVFPHTHFLEIVDEDGNPTGPNEEGYVVVTVLTNHSMPLIRYKIGDMATLMENGCSCGRPFPKIGAVTGRVTDHFITREGELVHGEIFTHLFYDITEVRKFRVVQESIDGVRVLVECEDGNRIPPQSKASIHESIKKVLGEDVSTRIDIKERLPPSDSGKYRYTISEVNKDEWLR